MMLDKCDVIISPDLELGIHCSTELCSGLKAYMDGDWPVWMKWRWWWCWRWWPGCRGRCCSRSHPCSLTLHSWCSWDAPSCLCCCLALMKPWEPACHRARDIERQRERESVTQSYGSISVIFKGVRDPWGILRVTAGGPLNYCLTLFWKLANCPCAYRRFCTGT